jgi:hypothetical protein
MLEADDIEDCTTEVSEVIGTLLARAVCAPVFEAVLDALPSVAGADKVESSTTGAALARADSEVDGLVAAAATDAETAAASAVAAVTDTCGPDFARVVAAAVEAVAGVEGLVDEAEAAGAVEEEEAEVAED